MNQETPHRLTPLAILIVFVLTIPGLVIGQIVSFVYGWSMGGMLDGNLFDWISGGWFNTIFMAIVPNALAGSIGGYFGIRVTFAIKPLKQANYEIAAYAMSAIFVVLAALATLLVLTQEGMNSKVIETISNAIGLIIGLFSAQQSVRDDQRALVTT
jgi:hypothetical protein